MALSLVIAFTGDPDTGSVSGPAAATLPQSEVVASRTLFFNDGTDGTVHVLEAATGRTIETIQPGEGGFVRGTLRGFARERRKFGLPPHADFTLTSWANGRLTLMDPETGRLVELSAFGTDNKKTFRRFLMPEEE